MADALTADLALTRGELSFEVALDCAPGITVIMGPSGAGKSTVLAMLAGLARPDRGAIALGRETWFDSARGLDVATHRRGVAYVFQNLALFPHLTAVGNVQYGMARGIARAQRNARARDILDRLGVGHLAARRPRTFSGGEAQRVALARAIASAPRLILLDEPFSALNHELRAQLMGVVRELARELTVPIVHVTHSVAEARALADQVVRLDRGKVVARGPAAELLAGVTSLDE